MLIKFVERLSVEDAMTPPLRGSQKLKEYSEWQHFNFNDQVHDLYGICNLAISGDIYSRNEARAAVSLVVWQRNVQWHGSMNMYCFEEIAIPGRGPALRLGNNAITFRNDRYTVKAATRDRSVILDASFIPACQPMRVDNIGAIVSSLLLPSVKVNGHLRIAGKAHRLDGATGYHDHNWGCWNWGRDLGWDWGYAHHPSKEFSLVFGRVTEGPRIKSRCDLVVLLWRKGAVRQTFIGESVRLSHSGTLTGVRIPCLPGALAALGQKNLPRVPERVTVLAEDGSQRLSIDLAVETAIQFIIPHASWEDETVVTEALGEYRVHGVLDGDKIDFRYYGFAEIAGC